MPILEGLDELTELLQTLGRKGARRIGGAAINAGLEVLEPAIRSACPGHVADEVGSRRMRPSGMTVRGVVGLGAGGAETHVDQPHGHFLALGTEFIQARPFVRDAIASSTPSVGAAMQQAASDALTQLAEASP
jgi:hypothetical protein